MTTTAEMNHHEGAPMTTTDTATLICPATWDGQNFPVHRCTRPLDHRGDHECGCQAQAPQCGAEYAPDRRKPGERGARIVRCDRVAGHDGDHEELFTTITWAQTTGPTTTAPAAPTEARKRVEDARRHLYARIIASAHLLDTPFSDAPDQSPWTRLKSAMSALAYALEQLDAEDTAPGVYQLPAEPDAAELWDCKGLRWTRIADDQPPPYLWWCDDDSHAPRFWRELLTRGPLTTAPPAGTGGER